MTLALIGTIGIIWWIEWFSHAKFRSQTPELKALALRFGSRLLFSTLLFGGLFFSGCVTSSLLGFGKWNVTVQGLWWLGIPAADTWVSAILSMLPVISAATGLAIYLTNRKNIDLQRISVATLMAVLLFSAVNAWIEELCFRVIPISFSNVSAHQAIWISALGFGLPHYFGFPSRWSGIALATFLGWFLAQMTLQTSGIAGAFLIHWVQDIVIMLLLSLSTEQSPFQCLGRL